MQYVFGDYALDTRRCELRRAGRLIKLRPKVFDVLLYLIAHRDRVISRQEILEHLWPQQFVGEATLSSCIMEARQAVGDTGQAQQFIQTLHGRGYRFVAAVEETSDSLHAGVTHALLAPLRAAALEDPGQAVIHASGPGQDTPADAQGSDVSPESLEGERKQVTILCCALADARGLVARLGSEAMYHLMRAFLALAQRVVQRYAGTLTQRLGDGFMAFFGAPVAHEDHARRAVLTALELQQRVREEPALRELLRGTSLSTSMGLHTGMVIVGSLGEEAQTLYAALDDTTDTAGRLQRLAGPDSILMSESTRRLVQEEVRVEVCDALDLVELPRPLPVYTVREVMVRRAGVTGRGGRLLSPFVGRQRELALLHERLDAVVAGQGQVVALVGEPGMGKSRLLAEYRRSLDGRPVRYIEGHCLSYGSATPYLPVIDLVHQLCGIIAGELRDAITAKVQQRLQEVDMATEESVPLLLHLLDIPVELERLARLSLLERKARTFALLRQLFLHEAQRQPCIITVENLHWIDPISEEWLTSLVERLPGTALLLLVTYRPGYQPLWLAQSYATQIALSPLRADDSRTVVQAVLQSAAISEALAQEILAKAAGNPFFLEELAWNVAEHGGQHAPLAVPETIEAVLAARLDRLPPTAKRLLQTAAVIGMQIDVPLLQAMADLSKEELHTHLDHLQAAEFLYEAGPPPTSQYTFKHALTQEVAYGSLLQE